MPRFFNVLRTGFIAIATSALILPSFSPAFAGERNYRGYDNECDSFYEGCVVPNQRHQNYHRHGNQQPHSHKRKHWQHAHKTRHVQPRVVQRHKKDDAGKWIVAGVIGLAAGAIILNEVKKNKRRQIVQQAQPRRAKPTRVHAGHGDNFQPWSPGWYRWCAERYRSFNPKTGTYRGFDGYDHFCVVK